MMYYIHIAIIIEIYIILCLSLNLQLGFTGLVNLAMGVFYGFGAYSYALLSIKYDFNFVPATIVAVLINMILSLFISVSSARFKGDIFILVSLAFQIIGNAVIWNWETLTGGAYGLRNIPRPTFLNYTLTTPLDYFVLSTVLLMMVILFSRFVYKSNFGNTLQAIRDDELAARTLGKNVLSFKIISVALGCGIAAISGAIYASYITYIDTTSFTTKESLDILFILVLGGLANIRGSIIGTILFVVSQELFKTIGFSDGSAFFMRNIIFSGLIIALLYYKPKGIFGKISV